MSVFRFKHFDVLQKNSPMKVGTDAMLLGVFADPKGRKKGLDIGTGTGVLALMMAQKDNSISMEGIEVDTSAYHEATVNFNNSKWSDRLVAISGDVRKMSFQSKYDFIISNPPYFETSNINEDERKSRARHSFALPFSELLNTVEEILEEKGVFWFIAPIENRSLINDALNNCDLNIVRQIEVYGTRSNGVKRVIYALSFERTPSITGDSIIIRDDSGHYTDDYKRLTVDFHATSF